MTFQPSSPPSSPPPRVSHQDLRLALAGALAGMLTNTLLHPLDTVKTLRQTQPSLYRGVAPALKTIVRSRGPLALYAGIMPALVGSALSSALYFGVYEMAKARLRHLAPEAFCSVRSRAPLTALAASCGNIASSVLFVPKEVVKQRMQAGLHKGRFLVAAAEVVRNAGVTGLYRGYKATLLRNIPSTMIRFALYEELKLVFSQLGGGRKLKPVEFLMAGAVAGATASACTTPFDVVKTRFATGGIAKGTGVWNAMREVLRKEGVAGLYVGVKPRTIWAALFAAIGFSSYEMCKVWMLGLGGSYMKKVGTRPARERRRTSIGCDQRRKNVLVANRMFRRTTFCARRKGTGMTFI